MNPKSLATSYTIDWCRNWLPVTKIFLISWTNCQAVSFSDWGTETTPSLRVEWNCDSSWAVSKAWWIDFVSVLWNTLSSEIWHSVVRSITLIAWSNCSVTIDWDSKILKSWSAYTWSQWDTTRIDISSIIFVTPWVTIEAIRENI